MRGRGRSSRRYHQAVLQAQSESPKRNQNHMAPYGKTAGEELAAAIARYEEWREAQERAIEPEKEKDDPPTRVDWR